MRVLIIGSDGQLGTDLVQSFSDCQVTRYTKEDLDIIDEASVQQQIAFVAPDLVINSAAFTRVDECERESIAAFESQRHWAKKPGVGLQKWDVPFVHISTNYVFDGSKSEPYVETDSAWPLMRMA